MALLIDGYNLLHATDLFGPGGAATGLQGSRDALLGFLSGILDERERAETTIVFDASDAPPGLPRTLDYAGMTVHFARRYADADTMIEELIADTREPRALLVVSSDHRVQRAARQRGAQYIDSDQWYTERLAARRPPVGNDSEAVKPVDDLTPDEVDYWTTKFSRPSE